MSGQLLRETGNNWIPMILTVDKEILYVRCENASKASSEGTGPLLNDQDER